MTPLYVLWAWLFVALGLTFSILGPALPELRADFGVPLAASGLVFVAHSAGYFGGVLLAAGLADARGRKLVTGAGMAALATGMGLAALAPAWPWLLAAVVVAGGGFAFVDVGLNAAIGNAVPGAGKRAAMMNLLHAAFPVGTLVAPAGLALALRLGYGWRAAFAATAAGAAVSLAGFAPGSAPWRHSLRPGKAGTSGTSATSSTDDLSTTGAGHRTAGRAAVGVAAGETEALSGPSRLLRLLEEPHLRYLAAVQALYVGVEVGIAGWIATYLIEQFDASPAAGALATSLYWGGFLVGRPAIGYVAHRCGPQRVLPWLCIGGAAAAAAGVVAPSAVWAAAAYAAAGLAICGIFPTVMALALEGRTHDAGATAALITGAASVGGLVWPWLVGAVAQEAGLRAAMGMAAAPLPVMLALAHLVRSASQLAVPAPVARPVQPPAA